MPVPFLSGISSRALPAGSGASLIRAATNNIRPLSLATAATLAPKAAAVAPLGPVLPALGVAALVIGGLLLVDYLNRKTEENWAQLNQRQRIPTQLVYPDRRYPVGNKSTTSITGYAIRNIVVSYNNGLTGTYPDYTNINLNPSDECYVELWPTDPQYATRPWFLALFVNRGSGFVLADWINFGNSQIGYTQQSWGPIRSFSFNWQTYPAGGTPTTPLPGDPVTGGGTDPAGLLPPLPTIEPLPAYLPATEPQAIPRAVPRPQPAPDPEPAPDVADPRPVPPPLVPGLVLGEQLKREIARRYQPISPTVRKPEDAQQISRQGSLVQQPAAAPTTTPQDARKYGNRTITSGAPRPSPEAVAEELGRVEQKLAALLDMRDTTPDWIEELGGGLVPLIVNSLIDALTVDVPAKTWTLEAPCNVDANDEPLTFEQELPAADFPEATIDRLDAIMEALQVLKNWRQPVCRGGPRSNVTVTAFEIEPTT